MNKLRDEGLPTTTVAVGFDERPDLLGPWLAMPHAWPEFILHTRPPRVRVQDVRAMFPQLKRFWIDADAVVVAHIHAVALQWDAKVATLPTTWNEIVERAVEQRHQGVRPNTLCALGAEVRVGHHRRGLGTAMLKDLKQIGRKLGLGHFIAPARPTAKASALNASMASFAARLRADGLPQDPWLRCHVRGGAHIVGIMEAALVVEGSVAQWRQWTGLPLAQDGETTVPGALNHVCVDLRGGRCRYVEDAVWVHQVLRAN